MFKAKQKIQIHSDHGSNLVNRTYESHIFPFYHYLPQGSRGVSFGSDLIGFVEYYVHVLVESEDFAFQSDFVVIEEPYFDSGFVLQESENDG